MQFLFRNDLFTKLINPILLQMMHNIMLVILCMDPLFILSYMQPPPNIYTRNGIFEPWPTFFPIPSFSPVFDGMGSRAPQFPLTHPQTVCECEMGGSRSTKKNKVLSSNSKEANLSLQVLNKNVLHYFPPCRFF